MLYRERGNIRHGPGLPPRQGNIEKHKGVKNTLGHGQQYRATAELNVPPGDEWASERYKERKEVTTGLARWGTAGAKTWW